MTCKCGHAQASHVDSLFGVVCQGREWHDQGSYQCNCVAFSPAEIAADIPEIPW